MKTIGRNVLHVLILILTTCTVVNAQNTAPPLLFGKSQVDITPEIPVNLEGYGQQRISSGVDDSIYCRVAYFRLEDKELVLISNDVCVIPDQLYEAIRDSLILKFGFDRDEIFITATHTHSGPDVTLQETYSYKNNIVYTKTFINKVILAVWEAMEKTSEAKTYFSEGKCEVAVNRRLPVEKSPAWPGDGGFIAMASNPDGLVDHDVQVINVFDNNDRIRASLFNYGCHNRARPPHSTKISNDFFGIASTQLETYFRQNLFSDAIALSLARASGDIDPLHAPGSFGYTDGNVPDPPEMGEELKTSVVNTFYSKEESPINKIHTKFIHLQLPAKNYFTYTVNPNLPKQELNITIATLGDICLIGIGAEVCVEIGFEIKNLSPFKNTVIITHCNGASGYLPSGNMYAEKGYEVSGSLFAPGADNQVITQTINALDSLYQLTITSFSEFYTKPDPEFQAEISYLTGNPGNYVIKFKNVKQGRVSCQLFTLDGKIIYNETFNQNSNCFTKHLDFENMHGIFLLNSVSGKSMQTDKIIVTN